MDWCKKFDTSDIVSVKKILLYKIYFFLFKYYQYILKKIGYKYHVMLYDPH